jgi:hypothetical protein
MSTFIDYSLSSLFQLFSTIIREGNEVVMSNEMKGEETSEGMEVDDKETEDQSTDHPTTPPQEPFIPLQRSPSREVVFLSTSA